MKKRGKLKKIIFIIIGILLLIAIGILVYVKFIPDDIKERFNTRVHEIITDPEVTIVDLKSDTRVYAVMINNNHQAWPHAGLDKSFLNYEIIVEGGISRIMALFRDVEVDKIGSVRSSRPYFLDYVLENDAIYVHWGGSTQAYSDISTLGINNLDGITYEGRFFYRDRNANKIYEHTGFTKTSMIADGAESRGYRKTSEEDLLLDYTGNVVDLSKMDDAQKADNIEIEYSNYQITSYVYDSENNVYLRSMSGKPHVDAVSGEQYSAKNIITYKVNNKSIDSYGRQVLYNVGSGDGYYITNGYAIPIYWEKNSRSSKTIYKYKDSDKEIEVSDGNTWIHIQPQDKKIIITANEENIVE